MDTPRVFEHPDWVAEQRRQIADMKRRNSEVMMQAFTMVGPRQETALHVYQTLVCQQDTRLKRLYGPDLVVEQAGPELAQLSLFPDALSAVGEDADSVPDDLLVHRMALDKARAGVARLLVAGEGEPFDRSLVEVLPAYRTSGERRAFLAALNTLLRARGVRLASVQGRADNNLWRHGLIGSSVPDSILTEDDLEDFPGTDSVASFVSRLHGSFTGMVDAVHAQFVDHPERRGMRWYHEAPRSDAGASERDVRQKDPDFDTFIRELFAQVVPHTGEIVRRSRETMHD